MNYHNQLVLTGEINDDGAYIRKNTGKSYRTGLEFSGGYRHNSHIELSGNVSFMSGKTDYRAANPEGGITEYRHVDLSFSPRVVGGIELRLSPFKNLAFDWQLKHVSKQFLDNTGNKNLALDDYTTNDWRFSYLLAARKFAQVEFTVLVLNLFNVQYESNGYVYENTPYYYPQAGIHFMGGISVRF